jgi:hypothetical protein
VIDQSSEKVVLTQKRHNLPVTCMGFLNSYDFSSSPNVVVTGSADYLYNMIAIPQGASFIGNLFGSIFSLLWHVMLLFVIVFYLMKYLP